MIPIINPFQKSGQISPQKAILNSSLISSLLSPLTRDGGAVEVYGEQGMGKTTILRYVANPPQGGLSSILCQG